MTNNHLPDPVSAEASRAEVERLIEVGMMHVEGAGQYGAEVEALEQLDPDSLRIVHDVLLEIGALNLEQAQALGRTFDTSDDPYEAAARQLPMFTTGQRRETDAPQHLADTFTINYAEDLASSVPEGVAQGSAERKLFEVLAERQLQIALARRDGTPPGPDFVHDPTYDSAVRIVVSAIGEMILERRRQEHTRQNEHWQSMLPDDETDPKPE